MHERQGDAGLPQPHLQGNDTAFEPALGFKGDRPVQRLPLVYVQVLLLRHIAVAAVALGGIGGRTYLFEKPRDRAAMPLQGLLQLAGVECDEMCH